MEHCPSWKATSILAGQSTVCLIRYMDGYHWFDNTLPMDSILGQQNSVCTLTPYKSMIVSITYSSLRVAHSLQVFRTKLCTHFLCLRILLLLIILTIFGELYYLIGQILNYVGLIFFCQNILISCPNTVFVGYSLMLDTKFNIHIKQHFFYEFVFFTFLHSDGKTRF